MLSSEDTVPSSPSPTDNAIFSEEPTRASSPPSSPPGFPWEETSSLNTASKALSKPAKSAFSLLGKRKALTPISDNARSAKKRVTAKNEANTLTQMQISLGQEVQKKCKTCGMEYIASSAEDRKLHDTFHKQNTEGYDVGRDFIQKTRDHHVFKAADSGDSICAIDCFDKPARKRRAQAVLEIVQRELGAVPIPEKQIWDSKECERLDNEEPKFEAYMYIRGTKCVGFLLTEKVKEAHRVVEPVGIAAKRSTSAVMGVGGMTALSALKARKQAMAEAAAQAASQPIQLSKNTHPAQVGISRIWTSPTHRQQNIAMTLVDTALLHHNQRYERAKAEHAAKLVDHESSADIIAAPREEPKPLERAKGKEGVAFSQPTEAGARLARRWFGKLYGWSVYVD